ncbi:hypothetical protein H4R19_000229 [Coemansia spiralis]|nr:hypothetical protein H4R19_000229 [Coemansia spiralis]
MTIHASQHQHGPLPSSTRSRRVSGNHAARPGLHQAEYGRASPQRTANPSSSPPGVSLQSWARMQYESSTQHQQQQQQQQQQQRQSPPRSPAATAPMFHAQYHFAPRSHPPVARPQSSGREAGHGSIASADYIDPYQDTPRGQTLDLDAGAASRKPGPARNDAPRPNAPPSPVMRAVRHSRPTTPNSAGAVSALASGEFLGGAMPLPAHRLPATDVQPPADPPVHTRMKPRSYTAAEDSHHRLSARTSPTTLVPPRLSPPQPHLQARPRVGSMHTYDNSMSALPVPVAQMRVEVGHAGTKPATQQQQPRTTSELANAAIRDFVDMKAGWALKTSAAQKPSPPAMADLQPKQAQQWPRQRAEPVSKISPETSHLIEFIERQRARTMAVPATTDADAERERRRGAAKASPEMPVKRSDSAERSFKRSTARLADVSPAQHKPLPPAPPAADRGYRYTSWYDPPVRVPSAGPGSAHSSPGMGPVTESRPILAPSIAGLPPSTRIVPRARAQTTAEETPAATPMPPLPQPPQPVIGGGGVTNRRGERLSRGSHDSLLPPNPRVYSRQTQIDSAAARAAEKSLARNPQCQSVGVQTDEAPALQPLAAQPETRSRGVQTAAAATIHGDDTVLDLMRQLDSLRQGHANQISEYQEQVVDLELLNQDLNHEVEQLSHRLEAKEAVHAQAAAEMRQKLDSAHSRVGREIGEVKAMHAAKCDELGAQVSMLLRRCEAYKQRLVSLGVDEGELLGIAAQASAPGCGVSERVQIADQTFIETQYVEVRESSQEADYFKQLMDIEQSMENTTMALGFELKRTQAKYLEHAADFIREQMARLQTEARSESRLSMRGESRMSIRRSPAQSEPLAAIPDLPAADAVHAARCTSPVLSLAATLSQLAASAPVAPPLPPTAASSTAAPRPAQLRPKHQRVVGPEPSSRSGAGEAGSAPPAAEARPWLSQQPATLSSAFPAALAAAAAATRQHQPPQLGGSLGRLDARRAEWESRASGLSRMIASAAERKPPSPTTSSSSDTGELPNGLLLLGSGTPGRCHRSPLAGIASGFFSSSQESMATAVSEPAASIVSALGLSDSAADLPLSSSHPVLATPTKPISAVTGGSMSALTASRLLQPIVTKGASVGYSAGQRKGSVADIADGPLSSPTHQPLSASLKHPGMHWSPRSERKGAPRPHSVAAGDPRDMTAEELLESLKLPSSGVLGMSTPTRSGFGSLPRSPSGLFGSLGRSPLPRSGSYGDLSRTLPAPRFAAASEYLSSASDSSTLPTCTANSMASDLGFTPPRRNQASVSPSPSVTALSAVFDPKATVNINLGLDKSPARPPSSLALGAGSTRRHRRPGQRRRSRSVATWDRL